LFFNGSDHGQYIPKGGEDQGTTFAIQEKDYPRNVYIIMMLTEANERYVTSWQNGHHEACLEQSRRDTKKNRIKTS
jgi:hypothetical protein